MNDFRWVATYFSMKSNAYTDDFYAIVVAGTCTDACKFYESLEIFFRMYTQTYKAS